AELGGRSFEVTDRAAQPVGFLRIVQKSPRVPFPLVERPENPRKRLYARFDVPMKLLVAEALRRALEVSHHPLGLLADIADLGDGSREILRLFAGDRGSGFERRCIRRANR